LGEVGAQRRVRGYGLSLERCPLTRFAAQIDLSPLGRGEPHARTDRFNQNSSRSSAASAAWERWSPRATWYPRRGDTRRMRRATSATLTRAMRPAYPERSQSQCGTSGVRRMQQHQSEQSWRNENDQPPIIQVFVRNAVL